MQKSKLDENVFAIFWRFVRTPQNRLVEGCSDFEWSLNPMIENVKTFKFLIGFSKFYFQNGTFNVLNLTLWSGSGLWLGN